jgi:hypothetical protein
MTAVERTINHDDAGEGGGFGVFLKTQREARGISLEMIAERTYIQPEILVCIETERIDRLPEPVYIKGFVRAYAEAIDVDPAEAVLRYERHHAAYQQALSARQLRGRRRRLRRMMLTSVLMGSLVLAAALLLSNAPREAAKTPSIPPEEPISPEMQAQRGIPAAKAEQVRKDAGEPLMLTAVGLRETTLKIIVDGKRPRVYRLKVDTRLEIEAERDFNILIEDAGALTLYLNGEVVPVYGREGHQVTLQLP